MGLSMCRCVYVCVCPAHPSTTEYCVMSEPVNITWYLHGRTVQYHFMFPVYGPIRIMEILPSYNKYYYHDDNCFKHFLKKILVSSIKASNFLIFNRLSLFHISNRSLIFAWFFKLVHISN